MSRYSVSFEIRTDRDVADLSRDFFDRFDGDFGSAAGRLTASVVEQDELGTALSAAKTAAMRLEAVGMHPIAVDLDLVSVSDIADRVGRSRQNVRQWVTGERRVGGFPAPLGTPGGVRVWDWGSVNLWLRQFEGLGDEDQPLTREEAVLVDAWLAERRRPVGRNASGVRSVGLSLTIGSGVVVFEGVNFSASSTPRIDVRPVPHMHQ
jgi:hypothetical protein